MAEFQRHRSPLLQVHWLRVLLDEGHTLGALAMTNKLQMATELLVERRWVLTGESTGEANWRAG